MDTNRLSQGEMIAAIAALLLLIVMFIFSWFSLDFSGDAEILLNAAPGTGSVDNDANAWQAFDIIDIFLLVTILVAIGGAVVAATATSVNAPVAASAITAGLGILSFLLILVRVISPPSLGIPDNEFISVGRGIGVWLGLILTAAIAYGGWRAMEDEGVSLADQADRFRSGGASPPPPPPPPAS
jgi:heme A synthase